MPLLQIVLIGDTLAPAITRSRRRRKSPLTSPHIARISPVKRLRFGTVALYIFSYLCNLTQQSLVADYFTGDTLAPTVTRSGHFFDLLVSEQSLVADCFDWGHTRSVYYKVVTLFWLTGFGTVPRCRLFCAKHPRSLHYKVDTFSDYWLRKCGALVVGCFDWGHASFLYYKVIAF